ncbi:sodium:solute symporter family protein, partial [Bacteroides thetaiotaomicron]
IRKIKEITFNKYKILNINILCSIFYLIFSLFPQLTAVDDVLPHDIIARGTSIFMGICAAAFLPAYFCALYWKKATKQGVMASLWVGTLGSAFALIFLHQKEAAAMGICKFLFGKDVLIETYPFPVIDPILFALPLSILAIVVVSLLTGRNK